MPNVIRTLGSRRDAFFLFFAKLINALYSILNERHKNERHKNERYENLVIC